VIDLGDIPRGVTQTLFTYEFSNPAVVEDDYSFRLTEGAVLKLSRETLFIGPQPVEVLDASGATVFFCDSTDGCVTSFLLAGRYTVTVRGVAVGFGTSYSWDLATVTPIPAAAALLGTALIGLTGAGLKGRFR
jgi:hypothetical protein